ncbi:MAG: tetratricopeptide repeat protein [Terriglobales bacterium]|jgi:tetratricopeptide (TPR) repeat protein
MDQLRVLRVVVASPGQVNPERAIIPRVIDEVHRNAIRFFVMRRLLRLNFVLLLGALLCAASGVLWAESGVLVVHVKDVQRHPISGVQIGVEGDGGSSVTGDDGKARIALAKDTKEKSWVTLQILKSPPAKDFVMVSPWDYKTLVPSFENESDNFAEVVVVQRGDRAALESGVVLAALTAQLNKANAPKTADKQAPQEDPKANLAAVAKQYGLAPDDLDRAIRAWGAKTTDPYELGLAALYGRNYAKASAQLADSLRGREEKLAGDQRAVADAAFFLGQSLYEEGKYRDSATALQRCLQFRPDNVAVLNSLALSLTNAGDYADAEPLYRRALTISENALGADHPHVATYLSNLGSLFHLRGDYADAETLYRRALAIVQKALGPDSLVEGTILGNLASVRQDEADYAGAEPLYRRALAIREKALGPEHPVTAAALHNLASLLQDNGDYAGAEPLFRRALAILETSVGPDHPNVADVLNGLATLLQHRADYAGAEPLFRRALAIREKALGPDHPETAESLNNLAELLRLKKDYDGAEPLFRRALAISERSVGPDHPDVASSLNNLGLALQAKGRYADAEPLFRRALAIREKTLGPDHPNTVQSLCNLAALLHDEGNYASAESFVRRALAIDEKTLGPHHPMTERIRRVLQAWVSEEPVSQTEK